jgi:hypothetical protein
VGSYLQTYGVEEEHHARIVKRVVAACIILLVGVVAGYLLFRNFPERQKAKSFLAKINGRDFKTAYAEWGCTDSEPCPNYDFRRFLEDWNPKNASGPWKVESTDSCDTFLTVNVQSPGSELQSIAVQRSDHSLGFAPAPECQERKWRWKAFFQRLLGRGEAPPSPGK